MLLGSLREQIPALSDRVYLNTGTSGPVPLAAFQAQVDLLQRFSYEGYSTPTVAAAYARALTAARRAIAGLLNCSSDEIVLTSSTSDGVGIVAQGLTWEPGDEIITSDLEHIAGIAPWFGLAQRYGVRVVSLESKDGHLEAEDFRRAITARTKLICVSHVSWATGTVLPVEEICRTAREAGVLTLIDGAQSVGHIPIDLQDIACDFYTVSGQKWLLGPEGTGALFVRSSALEKVFPTRIGWSSLESPVVTDGVLHFQPDARRFETGTLHAPAYAGLAQSVNMLQRIGAATIFSHAVNLSALAAELLAELDHVTVLSPPATRSGLLTFSIPGDADAWVRKLWEEHKVIVRSIPHLHALRASFHAFNTEDDVRALVRAVAACQ